MPVRLFWRVDDTTLIGRFYLMHPIGVRPETACFEVGASFDYSFLPEMCPSGNVRTLCHSDEYYVVELQGRDHQAQSLRPGPLRPHELARALSKWTTEQHRENATHRIVFLADEVATNLGQVVDEADRFVAAVAELLAPKPQPYHNHPYWVGSIAVNRVHTGRATREDWRVFLDVTPPSSELVGHLWSVYLMVFGSLPQVTRFHPRWPDYRPLYDAAERAIAEGERVLLVTDVPTLFARWLSSSAGDVTAFAVGRLLATAPARLRQLYQPLIGSFDACIISLPGHLLGRAAELVERFRPFLKPLAEISILVMMTDRPLRLEGPELDATEAAVPHMSGCVIAIRYIPVNPARWIFCRFLGQPGSGAGKRSVTAWLALAIRLMLIGALTGLFSVLLAPALGWAKNMRRCSSVFITLRPTGQIVRDTIREA